MPSPKNTNARDTRGQPIHENTEASPEAARVGLASLMRPEGPLPDAPFAGCRYAVARTMPRRFSRLNWPGGVMASPLCLPLLSAALQARSKERYESVCLFALSVNPY
jgi:hypothetical protein